MLACDIHSRARTKRILKAHGAERVYGMDDILTSPVDGSGCNERFGLLGSNKSTEESVKLFPRECTDLVLDVQKQILDKTGKHVEVMVYGDGAFKDPVGKIWELADPCVSVANTEGLDVYKRQGKSIKECLEFAKVSAALSTTKKGAQTSIPKEEEVRKYL